MDRADMDPIRRLAAAVLASAFDDLEDAQRKLRLIQSMQWNHRQRITNAIDAARYLITDREFMLGPDLDLWVSVLDVKPSDVRSAYEAKSRGILEAIVRELVRIRDRLPRVTRDRITAVEYGARELGVAA